MAKCEPIFCEMTNVLQSIKAEKQTNNPPDPTLKDLANEAESVALIILPILHEKVEGHSQSEKAIPILVRLMAALRAVYLLYRNNRDFFFLPPHMQQFLKPKIKAQIESARVMLYAAVNDIMPGFAVVLWSGMGIKPPLITSEIESCHSPKTPWMIDPKDLVESETENCMPEVGWTTTAGVYKGKIRVAVRRFQAKDNEDTRHTFKAEATFHYRMSHPSLVSILGAGIQKMGNGNVSCIFLTEECNQTLDVLINEGYFQDADQKRKALTSLFEGLGQLHLRYLIHGRIHPKNVVLNNEGQLTLRNFQFSRFSLTLPQSEMSSTEKEMMCWRAPEQLQNIEETSTACDVYSLGLVAAYIMTSHAAKTQADVQKHLDTHWRNQSEVALILSCCRQDPLIRPSAIHVFCSFQTGVEAPETVARIVRCAEDAEEILSKCSSYTPKSKSNSNSKSSSSSSASASANASSSSSSTVDEIEAAKEKGDMQKVLTIMSAHPNDAEIQTECCYAFSSMANENSDMSNKLGRAGVIKKILAAVDKHKEDVTLLERTCELMAVLSRWSKDTAKEIIDLRAHEKVIAAMKKHPKNARLQEACSAILGNCIGQHMGQMNKLVDAGCVEALAEAMKQHTGDRLTVQLCFQTLQMISQCSNEMAEKVAKGGGIVAIITGMKKIRGQRDHEFTAMKILSYITTANLAYAEKMGKAGAGDAILTVMGTYKDDFKIQSLCIVVLSSIAQSSKALADKLGNRSIQGILEGMKQHLTSDFIQEQGSKALACFSQQGKEHSATIGNLGGVEQLVNMMRRIYNKYHQVYQFGCVALANCLVQHPPNIEKVMKAGGVEVVLSVIKRLSEVDTVQEGGFHFLNMIATHNEAAGKQILLSGGVEAIIAGMKKTLANLMTQRAGCHAISGLAGLSVEHANKIGKEGGIEVLIAAMNRHKGILPVQEMGCQALTVMAQQNKEHARKIAMTGGGLQALLSSMAQHTNAPRVHELKCICVTVIAQEGEESRKKIALTNGVESVLTSMKNYAEYVQVQEVGFAALGIFAAARGELSDRMVQVGGIEMYLSIMSNYKQSMRVQQVGSMITFALAEKSKEIAQRLVKANAIEALVTALRLFGSELSIQGEACKALAELAKWTQEIAERIVKAGAIELIDKAMTTYRQDEAVQGACQKAFGMLAMRSKMAAQKIKEVSNIYLVESGISDCGTQMMTLQFGNRNDVRPPAKKTRDVVDLTDEQIDEILKELEPEKAEKEGAKKKNKKKGKKGKQNKTENVEMGQDIAAKDPPTETKAKEGKENVLKNVAQEPVAAKEGIAAALKVKGENAGKPKTQADENGNSCVICFEGVSTHAYVPCGHRAVCEGCSLMFASRCPICNQASIMCTRIFKTSV
eukprot:763033-Hanusia_phi.AAC.1